MYWTELRSSFEPRQRPSTAHMSVSVLGASSDEEELTRSPFMAREQRKSIECLIVGLDDEGEWLGSDIVLSRNEGACESNCTGENGGGPHIEDVGDICGFGSFGGMISGLFLVAVYCGSCVVLCCFEDEDVTKEDALNSEFRVFSKAASFFFISPILS